MGPGCPTVLIGGLPAARLTDMHICPMITPGVPPVPHVGGQIVGPVPPTVFVGKAPAARVGDIALCVGPPSSILPPGCPTVLIGQAGGSGVSSGSGAPSSVAPVVHAKGVMPGRIKGVTSEGSNIVRSLIVDDPGMRVNAARLDRRLVGEGYVLQETGNGEAELPKVIDAVWSRQRCWFREEVTLTITTANLGKGADLEVALFEWDATDPDDPVETFEIKCNGDETRFAWRAEFDASGLYESGEGDDFEIYPIVKVASTGRAGVFRGNLLYVDVVLPYTGT